MIDVLYKDEDIIVVNKPSGMLVHPYNGKRNREPTLLHTLRDQEELYLYPLHRLDRPVSGAIIFGLSKKATSTIKENWNTEETKKEYITLVRGRITQSGKFDEPMKNDRKKMQEAITLFDPIKYYPEYDVTLLKVSLKTGRKHQIRRHFNRYCYNLIGDTMYGKGSINIIFREVFNLNRIFLHAHKLSFVHPIKNELIQIKAPLSPELLETLVKMNTEDEIIHSLSL